MAWIESHQELETHPKVLDLMNSMEWNLDQTIGKLHRFWWWCMKYADDGDLRKHNDGRIAGAMGVAMDDSKRLVEVLIQACWLERKPYFRVHDWWDYAKYGLIAKYKREPKKWQRIRKLYNGKCVTVVTTVVGTDNQTYQTNNTKPEPNQTKPKDKNNGVAASATSKGQAKTKNESQIIPPASLKPLVLLKSEYQKTVDFWCAAYKSGPGKGMPYPFGAKDGKQIQRLAGIYGHETLRALLAEFLTIAWDWYDKANKLVKVPRNLQVFESKITELLENGNYKLRIQQPKTDQEKYSGLNPVSETIETVMENIGAK